MIAIPFVAVAFIAIGMGHPFTAAVCIIIAVAEAWAAEPPRRRRAR